MRDGTEGQATGMSGRLVRAAWKAPVDSSSELVVLLALADYANNSTESTFPSISKLAEKCHSSPRTVTRILDRLRRKGLIDWQTRQGQANLYTFNLGHGDIGNLGHGDISHPVTPATVSGDLGHGDTPPLPLVADITIKEPSINQTSDAHARDTTTSESDTVSHHPRFPELAKAHLLRLIPDLSADDIREWEDAWYLTCESRERVAPGLSIIEYLVDCPKRKIRPSPGGFTRWFSRAEQFARQDEVKASQAGTVEAEQPKPWWER